MYPICVFHPFSLHDPVQKIRLFESYLFSLLGIIGDTSQAKGNQLEPPLPKASATGYSESPEDLTSAPVTATTLHKDSTVMGTDVDNS